MKQLQSGSYMVQAMALGLCVMLTLPAQAQTKTERVPGVDYAVEHTMAQNLQSLTGKQVTLILVSGNTLTGTVKNVNDELLHLEKLDQKAFFDALVRIKDVSAIETRFLVPVR